jgi:uncharacterized protein
MGNLNSFVAAVLLLVPGQVFAACAPGTVELRGPAGVQRFHVEIADSEAERSRGLMQRDQMPSASGMLFVYPAPQQAFFWMKDTLIPLDMIFADASGKVTRVHSNAIPEDETPIDGGKGVTYVLEINGGLAKRMGIAEGAELRAGVLEQSGAVWPCSGE